MCTSLNRIKSMTWSCRLMTSRILHNSNFSSSWRHWPCGIHSMLFMHGNEFNIKYALNCDWTNFNSPVSRESCRQRWIYPGGGSGAVWWWREWRPPQASASVLLAPSLSFGKTYRGNLVLYHRSVSFHCIQIFESPYCILVYTGIRISERSISYCIITMRSTSSLRFFVILVFIKF